MTNAPSVFLRTQESRVTVDDPHNLGLLRPQENGATGMVAR